MEAATPEEAISKLLPCLGSVMTDLTTPSPLSRPNPCKHTHTHAHTPFSYFFPGTLALHLCRCTPCPAAPLEASLRGARVGGGAGLQSIWETEAETDRILAQVSHNMVCSILCYSWPGPLGLGQREQTLPTSGPGLLLWDPRAFLCVPSSEVWDIWTGFGGSKPLCQRPCCAL